MSFIILIAVLIVLDIAAMRFGADSRELDVRGSLPASMRAQI